MLVFEGDTVYISIRDIASYVGYQSYSGDYSERSEAKYKCYIKSENEIYPPFNSIDGLGEIGAEKVHAFFTN